MTISFGDFLIHLVIGFLIANWMFPNKDFASSLAAGFIIQMIGYMVFGLFLFIGILISSFFLVLFN